MTTHDKCPPDVRTLFLLLAVSQTIYWTDSNKRNELLNVLYRIASESTRISSWKINLQTENITSRLSLVGCAVHLRQPPSQRGQPVQSFADILYHFVISLQRVDLHVPSRLQYFLDLRNFPDFSQAEFSTPSGDLADRSEDPRFVIFGILLAGMFQQSSYDPEWKVDFPLVQITLLALAFLFLVRNALLFLVRNALLCLAQIALLQQTAVLKVHDANSSRRVAGAQYSRDVITWTSEMYDCASSTIDSWTDSLVSSDSLGSSDEIILKPRELSMHPEDISGRVHLILSRS